MWIQNYFERRNFWDEQRGQNSFKDCLKMAMMGVCTNQTNYTCWGLLTELSQSTMGTPIDQTVFERCPGEMRTLLQRICNVNEMTKRARQKKNAHDASVDVMSEAEQALFQEIAADDAFGEDVTRAVRNDQLRHQEAFYPAYAHGASPAWMQQMLGWQLAADLPHGQLPQAMPPAPPAQGPPMLELSGVGLGVAWTEPWAPWQWNNFSTASSSGAPADLPMSELQ